MDRKIKCLITDFDETFFRTAITAPLKQQKPIDWEKIYSLIPQFEMYPGWSDLLKWLKDNNIRFAVREKIQPPFKYLSLITPPP